MATGPSGQAAGHDSAKRSGLTVRMSPKVVVAVLILAAAIWFILVNRWTAHIRLWVAVVSAPIWLVLVLMFLGGLITGLLMRRGKSKKQRQG